jgi:HAD superfamily hydrolase (TIGR01509 family)
MIADARGKTIAAGAIQAVIFDLDGILVDSEWLSFVEWQKLARQHGGTLEDSVFPELVGTTAEETAALVMRHAGVGFDVPESCAAIWRLVTERLKREIEPLPGSPELVRSLVRRGYPLAIASNSLSDYIENALEGLGMAAYFPVWASRDQVAEGKPAPDVYLLAADRLGIAPERCLAIEDSRVGVQAAAAAGMRVVAVPGERDHRNGFTGAWRVYRSLGQVNQEINELLFLAS